MATSEPDTQDAPTDEEVALPTNLTDSPKHIPMSKRNAFTTLMSASKFPKRKRTPPPSTPLTDPARTTTSLGRNGLGAYIASPETYPATRVIYHSPSFVLINDLYPKSSIHLLLLPRDPAKQLLHPFEAFDNDPRFLSEVRAEVGKAKALAAGELRRRFGQFSARERARREWEEKEDRRKGKAGEEAERPHVISTSEKNDGNNNTTTTTTTATTALAQEEPPPGRDWSREIIAGVHAVPSMSHLHIHVLSRDRHSDCLKHRKHYNSFATDFLVPLEAFPLAREDPRRWPGREGYLAQELRCWRCGRGFGKGFSRLKEHLGGEFEAWRAE